MNWASTVNLFNCDHVLIFYTVFIVMKKEEIENKYPFLDRDELGFIENIEKR
jgi:hypothetical protein